MVLMTIRLLLPPGICICTLNAGGARLLAMVLGSEMPATLPDNHDEGDHAPGCPASALSWGLGVSPPAGPGDFTSTPAWAISTSSLDHSIFCLEEPIARDLPCSRHGPPSDSIGCVLLI
jgi:hypothetical protein